MINDIDYALETVRQVHHREMHDFKESVIKRLDEIAWSIDPNEGLNKYTNELRREQEKS